MGKMLLIPGCNTIQERAQLVEKRLDECSDLLEFAIAAVEFRVRRLNPDISNEEVYSAIKQWLSASSDIASDRSMEFCIRNDNDHT